MNIDEVREKKTASKEIYKGHILDVYVDDVTLPSGRKTHREVIRHCHASAILAINEKNAGCFAYFYSMYFSYWNYEKRIWQ